MSKINANIISNLVGTYFEFFDFMLFAFCIPIFLGVFSIPERNNISSILVWSAFAISYFVRPLGSVFFGLVGDLFGRKISLSFSTLLMSIPTITIGLIPPYSVIGKWSLLLLIICRILQGFAVSGEYTGSIVNLYESTSKNKCLFCSLTGTACALGVFSGSLLLTLFRSIYALSQNEHWWRETFITAGVLVGLSGLLIRYLTTAEHISKKTHVTAAVSNIFHTLYLKEKTTFFSIFLLAGFASILSYIIFAFLPNHMQKLFGIEIGLQVSTFCIFFAIVTTPLSGILSDKYGYEKIMLLTTAIILVFFPFLTFALTKNNLLAVVAMYALCSGLTGLFGGALCSYLVEKFGATTRYTGSTVAYNMAICFIGPITPLALMVLWKNQLMINIAFITVATIVLFFLFMNLVVLKNTDKTSNEHKPLL